MRSTFLTITLGSIATCNAAVVALYSGQNCQGDPYTYRNVYDNTCATGTGGYQSFMITTAGSNGQQLTTWCRDACAGNSANCAVADQVGTCYNAYDDCGGSNAMSSSTSCYVA